MGDFLSRFATFPPHGIAALVVLIAYAVQAEIRFGRRARKLRTEKPDRMSTLAVSIATAFPVLGFIVAMRASSAAYTELLPHWFKAAVLPGLPATGWIGVAFGVCGLALRLWAVLVLRERYTRTLLVQDGHTVERGGPYRWVRHPGYLGSLLCLNGIALASGNWIVLLASLAATLAAYAYRVKVEDEMLVAAFGPSYSEYRDEVRALLPFPPKTR